MCPKKLLGGIIAFVLVLVSTLCIASSFALHYSQSSPEKGMVVLPRQYAGGFDYDPDTGDPIIAGSIVWRDNCQPDERPEFYISIDLYNLSEDYSFVGSTSVSPFMESSWVIPAPGGSYSDEWEVKASTEEDLGPYKLSVEGYDIVLTSSDYSSSGFSYDPDTGVPIVTGSIVWRDNDPSERPIGELIHIEAYKSGDQLVGESQVYLDNDTTSWAINPSSGDEYEDWTIRAWEDDGDLGSYFLTVENFNVVLTSSDYSDGFVYDPDGGSYVTGSIIWRDDDPSGRPIGQCINIGIDRNGIPYTCTGVWLGESDVWTVSVGPDGFPSDTWTVQASSDGLLGSYTLSVEGFDIVLTSANYSGGPEGGETQDGSLTVSCRVTSNHCVDRDAVFGYEVILSDTSINGAYGDMEFMNGIAALCLTGGHPATATGLPNGITYEVQEIQDAFREICYSAVSSSGTSGTISSGTRDSSSNAVFTYTRKTGSLDVHCNVVSNLPSDANFRFDYTVTIGCPSYSDGFNCSFSGTYGNLTFRDGSAVFDLVDGETMSIEGLPAGVSYYVGQWPYNGNGFSSSVVGNDPVTTGDNGEIRNTTASYVSFTNARRTVTLPVSAPENSVITVANDGDIADVTEWESDGTSRNATLADECGYTVSIDNVKVALLRVSNTQVFRQVDQSSTQIDSLALTSEDIPGSQIPDPTPEVAITTTVKAPASVDLSGLTYTYDFQAAEPVEGEGSAFPVPSGVDISSIVMLASESILTAGSDSVRTIADSVNLPDPNSFGHAGVYAFTVSESVSGKASGDSWDDDQSVYKVRLYVVNDGNGGLAYDSVDADGDGTSTPYTIELVQDIDGTATSSKVAEATFLNIYNKLTDLTVTKAVSGDYANRTKEFAFDLVIDLPDYVADTTYAYTVGGVSATATAVEHVITISNFTLSADETLSFSNVLPVGSTYTLVEKDPTDGVNNYVPTASYTYAGIGAANSGYETHTSTVAAGSAGGANYAVAQTSAASPNGNTALGAALGNAVTVTNTLSNPPSPTGVLVSVLPFAMMILIPIALGAVYFKTRRRDEEIYF